MSEKDQLEHVFFNQIRKKDVRWLWHRRVLLEKLNNLVGHPGEGKTFIGVDLAARVSTGAELPDRSGKAPLGNVIFISAEDDYEDTLYPRLEAHKADLSRVACITGKKGSTRSRVITLDLDLDHSLLEDKIYELNAILVILDPVLSFTGKRINPNAEVQVREFLAPLADIAGRTGSAILGMMHFNKKEDLKEIQRVIGAMGWVGVPRSTMGVAEHPDKPGTFQFGTVKMNLAKKPQILSYHIEDAYPGTDSDVGKLLWDDELVDPYDPSTERTVPSESDRAIALLEELLSPYAPDVPGIPTVELNAEAQTRKISMPTLERARSKRGVKAQKVGDAWYVWLPSTDHKPPPNWDEILEKPALGNNGEGDEGDDGLEGLEGVE